MKHLIYIIVPIILLSCKKEEIHVEFPYSKNSIYHETFEDESSWVLLPENSVYTPNSECIRLEDKMLKLTFDQPLQNCGCAWVGAKKSLSNLKNIPKDKLGVRIRLNKGFFQEMVRENNSAETQGDHHRSGNVVSKSSFSFRSPVIQMNFPNSSNAWFPEDSIVSEDFNRIEGVEFEMIYNEGQSILIIDGLKVNSSLASISAWNILGQTGIDFEFTLGHQPEFSPRIDELFIDELEIFTWQGKYPD